MGSRRSGRSHKVVDYAKLRGSEEEDDFVDFHENKDTKRRKMESSVSQELVNCSEKDLVLSRKRLSLDERVFERHVQQAMTQSQSTIIKHVVFNKGKVKEGKISDDSYNDTDDDEECSTSGNASSNSEEEDDDFKPKSSSKVKRSKLPKVIPRKQQTEKFTHAILTKQCSVAVTDIRRQEATQLKIISPEKNSISEPKTLSSSLLKESTCSEIDRSQNDQECLTLGSVRIEHSDENIPKINSPKAATSIKITEQKSKDNKLNSKITTNLEITEQKLEGVRATSPKVASNPRLTEQKLEGNKVTSPKVATYPKITEQKLEGNKVTSPKVATNPRIMERILESNKVALPKVAANPRFSEQILEGNKVTSPKVTLNPRIIDQTLEGNKVTSPKVATNSRITERKLDDSAPKLTSNTENTSNSNIHLVTNKPILKPKNILKESSKPTRICSSTQKEKFPDLNTSVGKCYTSPLKIPPKGIRIGLSRKVVKSLHPDIRKTS